MKQITEFMEVNNMKKWNNPELMVLGVENTNEDQLGLPDGGVTFDSWGWHNCHRQPDQHSGNCSNGDGHTPTKVGVCSIHTEPIKGHEQYSCCCHS